MTERSIAAILPKRKAELDKAKLELNALLNKCHENLSYLAERWSDEKEYEDFADYENVMKKYLDGQSAIKFVRATKSPFGFVVTHSALPDHKVAFVVTRKSITWKLA